LVYNTNTAGDVTPGFYYLSSATGPWVRLATASPTSDSWLITGNTNIVDGTNFIGTAAGTNVDIAFKRNNLAAGKIGTNSTSFGVGALNVGAATTSTAFGKNALVLNTRNDNVAVGNAALSTNANGTGNVALGFQAGASELGSNKLYISNSNTSATTSLIYGEFAPSRILRTNSIFQIGDPATTGYVFPATRGAANQILQTNGTGSLTWANPGAVTEVDPKVQSSITNRVPKWDATATALVDGIINDDGTRVGIGTGVATPLGALEINSTNDGIVIPRVALTLGANFQAPLPTTPTLSEIIYNTNTTTNPAFGIVTPGFYFWNALNRWERFNTGTITATGWQTTGNAGLSGTTNFIGTTDAIDVAFRRNSAVAGKIGATSTSFGVAALTNGAGTNSTAFGNNALAASAGFNNVAVGQNALQALPSLAQFNTAVGTNALGAINNAASQSNTAIGFNAMGVTAGDISNCTAVGAGALLNIDGTTAARGLNNTGVGYQAGSNITRGENNTAIGYQAQVPNATGSNQIRIGNTAITTATTQVAWTNPSDRRWKNTIKDSPLGLGFIQTLRPVSYIRNNDDKNRTEYGFIAQEIEVAFNNAGDPNNAIISKDDNGMYGVRYNDFISISVKAIQEQQEQIEQLQKKNDELTKMNEVILKRLEALENK
jgi:trimeric autotransporter adhesin